MGELPVIRLPARFEALARPKRLKVFLGAGVRVSRKHLPVSY